ncbi:MAG: hypothetical protein MZV65_21480 [Chromatiales bacterium]|nr:hypothetical protein [Chromatiales bacterium]
MTGFRQVAAARGAAWPRRGWQLRRRAAVVAGDGNRLPGAGNRARGDSVHRPADPGAADAR